MKCNHVVKAPPAQFDIAMEGTKKNVKNKRILITKLIAQR